MPDTESKSYMGLAPPGTPLPKPATVPCRCPNCGNTEEIMAPWPPPWVHPGGVRPAQCEWCGFIMERVGS